MFFMRKLLGIILIAAISFCFTACGNSANNIIYKKNDNVKFELELKDDNNCKMIIDAYGRFIMFNVQNILKFELEDKYEYCDDKTIKIHTNMDKLNVMCDSIGVNAELYKKTMIKELENTYSDDKYNIRLENIKKYYNGEWVNCSEIYDYPENLVIYFKRNDENSGFHIHKIENGVQGETIYQVYELMILVLCQNILSIERTMKLL